jgi:hypothetical protein
MYKQYLSIGAEEFRKFTEFLEVSRQRSEVLLDEKTPFDVIAAKQAEIDERADRLFKEAVDISDRAERLKQQHSDLIRLPDGSL